MSEKARRLTGVDSLRGIAILMVLAVHTSGFIAPSSPWLSTLADLGRRGVQLFYVVSAFSLFLSFNSRKAAHDFSYAAYFIRRVSRVAPMFWLAMFLYLLAFGMGPRYWAPNGVTRTDVALTALFANGWSPSAINSIIPGGWSVAIETTFYLLLPLCFLWVRNLGTAVLVTGAALIARYELCAWQMEALQPRFPETQQYLPLAFSWELWLPAQLPVFMLGIVLFFLRERVRNKQMGLTSSLLVGSVVLIVASHDVFPDRFISNAFLAGIGFVLMALALVDSEVPFLDNALLRKIGEVSFSIYLLHHLVMHFGAQYVIKVLNVLNLGTSGDLSYSIAFAMIATASTLVSMLTFRVVEQPCINLGAKLAQRIDSTRRIAVTAEPGELSPDAGR